MNSEGVVDVDGVVVQRIDEDGGIDVEGGGGRLDAREDVEVDSFVDCQSGIRLYGFLPGEGKKIQSVHESGKGKTRGR